MKSRHHLGDIFFLSCQQLIILQPDCGGSALHPPPPTPVSSNDRLNSLKAISTWWQTAVKLSTLVIAKPRTFCTKLLGALVTEK
jgi:hypothetical protein